MKSIKVRLYPTLKQEELIDKTIGCCRFIYNQMLNERISFYQENKNNKEIIKSHKYKTEKEYKVEFPFLKEVSSRALQQSRNDLISAYNNFFKNKQGFPKFKSKHKCRWSYREPQVANQIKADEKRLQLLKLGKVKYKGNSLVGFIIRNVTVSKDKDNKYYASVLVDVRNPVKERKSNNTVGVDLGLRSFATLSNGEQIVPINLERLNNQIVKQHKHFSRKTKGSKRKENCRIKLASLYKQRNNILNHFFWHLANKLCSENQTIKIENLNVLGMKKNSKLSKAIHNISWSNFIVKLEQKAKEFNSKVIKIDRFFPSSKMCSKCKHIKEDLKLSDRVFHCEKCGLKIDRDLNASLNIKNYKLDELFDYSHGETVNLIEKFFNFNISSFVEVITQPINKCYVC